MLMKNRYDVIIVGAGTAGLSAGLYAGRARLRTLILDGGQPGGQIRITSDIFNYPGFEKITGEELTQNMVNQVEAVGVKIVNAQVEKLVTGEKGIHQVHTNQGVYEGVSIIVATGAVPTPIGFPGEKEFTGRGISYCATCDGALFTNKEVFVVGGGFAAAEEAVYLSRFAKKVYAVIRSEEYRCTGLPLEEVLSNPKIEPLFNTQIVSLEGKAMGETLRLKNTDTGEEWEYKGNGEPFGVFIFVGYTPQSQWLKGVVELDEKGYVLTDDHMETSVKGVYAAGDIRPKTLRQLVTAAADGAIAATQAQSYVHGARKKWEIDVMEENESAPKKEAPSSSEQEKEKEGFLPREIAEQVEEVFNSFPQEVEILGVFDQSDFSSEMKSFLEEVGSLSDKVIFKEVSAEEGKKIGIEKVPGFTFKGDPSIKNPLTYYILPAGHEFQSFLFALQQSVGLTQNYSQELLDRLNQMNKPTKVQVGVTLSCPMCPPVVQGMQALAAKAPWLDLEIIDVQYYPDFQKKHNIMSVPATVINDEQIHFGKTDISGLMKWLKEAQSA